MDRCRQRPLTRRLVRRRCARQRDDVRLGGRLAEHRLRRVAWYEVNEGEHESCHPEENRDGQYEATSEKSEHDG